jgi:hypothetical protein
MTLRVQQAARKTRAIGVRLTGEDARKLRMWAQERRTRSRS